MDACRVLELFSLALHSPLWLMAVCPSALAVLGNAEFTGVIGDTGGRVGDSDCEMLDGSPWLLSLLIVLFSAFASLSCCCDGGGGIVIAFIALASVEDAVQ